uniref:Reverse transcriptase domain-containing protein n=1 Tax=Nicotiana tabacum TaxID=4097 RepID=A0A1S3ZZ68_TOBAC
MYDGAKICVRTVGGVPNHFPVMMGLHQGSALGPFLFSLAMDILTSHIQGEVPWCVLFEDDIVFIDEMRDGVSASHFSGRGRRSNSRRPHTRAGGTGISDTGEPPAQYVAAAQDYVVAYERRRPVGTARRAGSSSSFVKSARGRLRGGGQSGGGQAHFYTLLTRPDAIASNAVIA